MKSVFNTLFSILAGGCAALLALKFVSQPPEEQVDYQTKMRSYTEEQAALGSPDITFGFIHQLLIVILMKTRKAFS